MKQNQRFKATRKRTSRRGRCFGDAGQAEQLDAGAVCKTTLLLPGAESTAQTLLKQCLPWRQSREGARTQQIRAGATSPREDEDDSVPEWSDKALIDLSKTRHFMQVQALCCGDLLCPAGQTVPWSWDLSVPGIRCATSGAWTQPWATQPLCSCFFQAEHKGKNNKTLTPTYLSVQSGVGRVTRLVKSIFFLPGEGFTFTSVKKCPRSRGLDPRATILQSLQEEKSNFLNIWIYILQCKYIVWDEREQSPHHSLLSWILPSCGITSEQQINFSPVLTLVPPVAFGVLLNTQHVQVSSLYIYIHRSMYTYIL